MTLTALRDPDLDHPRVAFSIRRAYGSAVQRNRARRRLRAVCRELDARGELPPGMYLVTPRDDLSRLDHAQLTSCIATAVRPPSSP
jgi:ribonuclease P protein component